MAIKLEEKKKYRITKGEDVMEFIPMTIDRKSNEVYLKITAPHSYHQGIHLSSLESKEGIEEIPM